jgi:hypothetical protein
MEHCELVSEREDLDVQQRARPECKAKRLEQRDDDGGHSSRLFKTTRNINGWMRTVFLIRTGRTTGGM